MDCLVVPVSLLRRRSTGSRLGYRPLIDGDELLDQEYSSSDTLVKVVVGKERKVFLVDPFILQENPFRVLMDISMRKDPSSSVKKDHFHFTNSRQQRERVIFVDVDDILFEHMLWLLHNDASSFFQLNLKEIIDFYTHDM